MGRDFDEPCPICGTLCPSADDPRDRAKFDCPQCGYYHVTRSTLTILKALSKDGLWRPLLVAHAIHRRRGNSDGMPLITSADLPRFQELNPSTPQEQVEQLILWLGDRLRNSDPGELLSTSFVEIAIVMGAASENGAAFIAGSLRDDGRLRQGTSIGVYQLGLTLNGWEEYEKLRRAKSDARLAFMAMPFGDDELDRVYKDCLRPAVEATGFKLTRLDEKPRAGLIDDRLRVEIRRSHFLIAELTNDNRGAYWEAGFAEGLGKPVIYTCRHNHLPKVHFDTNHHLIVKWELDKLTGAATELKATIRATLPEDAVLEDEPSAPAATSTQSS